jgi:hypothetical protein
VVELLDRLDQAQVPFLDQVLELEAPADVPLSDVDDETEVRFDHPLPRLDVPRPDAPPQILLLLEREELGLADLPKVDFQRVGGTARALIPVRLDAGNRTPCPFVGGFRVIAVSGPGPFGVRPLLGRFRIGAQNHLAGQILT